MKVLLVDDSEAVRLTMAALLEDAGHEVLEAGSLVAARGLLARAVDVAVLDLTLGDGSGAELIDELKRAHPRAAIVVLTGSEAVVADRRVDLVLRKGGDPGALVARLEQVVAGTRGA
jgi:DNA-binding response OmpR family regulator